MRKFLLVFSVFIICEGLSAQVNNYQLIELEGGRKFRKARLLFDSKACSYALIQGVDTLTISAGEIRKMIPLQENHFEGLNYFVSIGLLSGDRASEKVYSFSANYGVGYGLSRYAIISLNSGIDLHDDFDAIPLTLRVNSFLSSSRVSPLLYLGSGYGWINNEKSFFGENVRGSGGLVVETGAGLNVHFEEVDMQFSVGYKRQEAELVIGSLEEFGSETVEERTVNRLSLQIGFSF